jgi:ATP-dependent protease HslVU (ClpYQ) peptidase subunit
VNTNAENLESENNTNFTDKLDQGIKDLQQTALDINKEGRQDKLARDLQSKET